MIYIWVVHERAAQRLRRHTDDLEILSEGDSGVS